MAWNCKPSRFEKAVFRIAPAGVLRGVGIPFIEKRALGTECTAPQFTVTSNAQRDSIRGGAFGRESCDEDGALTNATIALMRRGQRAHWFSFCHLRRQPGGLDVCCLEEGSHQNLTTLAPRSETCSLQNCEQWISVVHEPFGVWYSVIAAWAKSGAEVFWTLLGLVNFAQYSWLLCCQLRLRHIRNLEDVLFCAPPPKEKTKMFAPQGRIFWGMWICRLPEVRT